MKQETLNLIANIDENTVILPKSEGGAFEMYQMDTIADLRKVSRNFMRTEKILESIDAKTSAASETVAGIVTEARIKEISKALDPIQATELVAGVTKYGTLTETALEGYQIARILGIDDLYYGGLISNVGAKTKGKAYYDTNTKQIYLCRETNNLNYVDMNKFTAFSNKSLLDKLENLYGNADTLFSGNVVLGTQSNPTILWNNLNNSKYKKIKVIFHFGSSTYENQLEFFVSDVIGGIYQHFSLQINSTNEGVSIFYDSSDKKLKMYRKNSLGNISYMIGCY